MKITNEWLKEKRACESGINWFNEQKETDSFKVFKALIADTKLDYANWLIVRVMKRKQYLAYAIFAAEQVIELFEKQYPKCKKPRTAIEAAKKVLKNDTAKNRKAAADVAYPDYAADAAAYAAADAAAYAADAAASAAAEAASYAASAAAYAADAAASAAAKTQMKLKILNYGLSLLNKSSKGL